MKIEIYDDNCKLVWMRNIKDNFESGLAEGSFNFSNENTFLNITKTVQDSLRNLYGSYVTSPAFDKNTAVNQFEIIRDIAESMRIESSKKINFVNKEREDPIEKINKTLPKEYMETLESVYGNKTDTEKEQAEMYRMQADVLHDICLRIRNKIPNFVSITGGVIELAIFLSDKKSANMYVAYEKQFIRKDFLTNNIDECHNNLYNWVSSAFKSDANWKLRKINE